MAIEYGLGSWDRYTGDAYEDNRLPLGIDDNGQLPEFLKSAGERGWELCSSLPFTNTVTKRAINGGKDLRKAEDSSEVMLLVFKRAE